MATEAEDEQALTEEEKKFIRWLMDKVRTEEFLDEAEQAIEDLVNDMVERDLPGELKHVAGQWEPAQTTQAIRAIAEHGGLLEPNPAHWRI